MLFFAVSRDFSNVFGCVLGYIIHINIDLCEVGF